MLELVAADQTVPPWMSRFVNGDRLWCQDASRRDPPRAGRKERRVLHAAAAALKCRIDDRDVAVRIWTEPLTVVLQRRSGCVEVSRFLTRVLRPKQQTHLDLRQRWMCERPRQDDELRTCRPREVVDVFAAIVMNGGAVGAVGDGDFAPGGSHDVAARNRQADVVDAVVGIELSAGMELVSIPSGVFEHANLREPLAEEVVV